MRWRTLWCASDVMPAESIRGTLRHRGAPELRMCHLKRRRQEKLCVWPAGNIMCREAETMQLRTQTIHVVSSLGNPCLGLGDGKQLHPHNGEPTYTYGLQKPHCAYKAERQFPDTGQPGCARFTAVHALTLAWQILETHTRVQHNSPISSLFQQ